MLLHPAGISVGLILAREKATNYRDSRGNNPLQHSAYFPTDAQEYRSSIIGYHHRINGIPFNQQNYDTLPIIVRIILPFHRQIVDKLAHLNPQIH